MVNVVRTYPMLQKAWREMLSDQGVEELNDYPFPSDLNFTVDQLVTVDNALSRLLIHDFETLCTGDQDAWPPIFLKMGENGELVHEVLDELFMMVLNWEEDEEEDGE